METWADISKAKNLLGWEPQVSLEEGLEKSVQWYMDNRHWLKEVQV
jgi:nucleoside-diphosphate-sugar epimerase